MTLKSEFLFLNVWSNYMVNSLKPGLELPAWPSVWTKRLSSLRSLVNISWINKWTALTLPWTSASESCSFDYHAAQTTMCDLKHQLASSKGLPFMAINPWAAIAHPSSLRISSIGAVKKRHKVTNVWSASMSSQNEDMQKEEVEECSLKANWVEEQELLYKGYSLDWWEHSVNRF